MSGKKKTVCYFGAGTIIVLIAVFSFCLIGKTFAYTSWTWEAFTIPGNDCTGGGGSGGTTECEVRDPQDKEKCKENTNSTACERLCPTLGETRDA